ncbi:MAG TPA: hypothetical protein VLS45_06240, partial [Methylomicrobium sp.]|nr:hypothetical protein [Methylomicrobium sp.]
MKLFSFKRHLYETVLQEPQAKKGLGQEVVRIEGTPPAKVAKVANLSPQSGRREPVSWCVVRLS